jgi:hypothetical protein
MRELTDSETYQVTGAYAGDFASVSAHNFPATSFDADQVRRSNAGISPCQAGKFSSQFRPV